MRQDSFLLTSVDWNFPISFFDYYPAALGAVGNFVVVLSAFCSCCCTRRTLLLARPQTRSMHPEISVFNNEKICFS